MRIPLIFLLGVALLPSIAAQVKNTHPYHQCDLDRYHPVRISDYFTPETTLDSSKPVYPESAKGRQLQGTVSVKVLISLRTGKVEKTCANSGPSELWDAAEEAASKFRFKVPSLMLKKDYAFDFLVFDFVLNGDSWLDIPLPQAIPNSRN